MKDIRDQTSNTSSNSQNQKLAKTKHYIKEKIEHAISEIKQQSQQKLDFLPIQTIKSSQLSYIKRISLNLEQQKTYRVLTQLRKGYLIKKHSPNTSEPHDKFIYLSEDHRFFCWKSVNKEDQKTFQLQKITNVVKGIQGAKSKTIISLPKEKRNHCLIIFNEVRNFQIEANNQEIVDLLYEGIQQVVKNSKRMHLSYKC